MATRTTQRQLALDLAVLLDRAPAAAQLLPEVVRRLPALLGADQACAFLVRDEGQRRHLDFFYGAHMPVGIRPAYARWLETAPRRFAAYDPARPQVEQRNVALRSRDLEQLTRRGPPPEVRSFLPRFALSESEQLRVLVCEGPSLLAWVGGFRAGGFGRDEVRLLDAITPALQRRLSLERRLAQGRQRALHIGAALEHVPAAAFVLEDEGEILHANAAGRSLLEADRRAVGDQLSRALQQRDPAVELARLDGDSGLQLAILQETREVGPRVAVARRKWGLTPRQAEVLQLVAQGLSNRAVAASLGCAESTVELHVTALLEKSQCEGRAHLIARLWSGI